MHSFIAPEISRTHFVNGQRNNFNMTSAAKAFVFHPSDVAAEAATHKHCTIFLGLLLCAPRRAFRPVAHRFGCPSGGLIRVTGRAWVGEEFPSFLQALLSGRKQIFFRRVRYPQTPDS